MKKNIILIVSILLINAIALYCYNAYIERIMINKFNTIIEVLNDLQNDERPRKNRKAIR